MPYNHFRAMDGVRSTTDNLQAAIEGENYEWVTMYPEFIKDAEAESDEACPASFKWAWEVEKVHERLYRKELSLPSKTHNALPEVEDYVCPVCGNTHEGPLEGKCPIWWNSGSRFVRHS